MLFSEMKHKDFIMQFRTDDVRRVALLGKRFPDVDMPFALNQIAGWQTARTKLPSWAAQDEIIYPPHISMEQCSSEQTARYKAGLVRGETLLDLTGGFGVDFSFMARGRRKAVYVERQKHLCEIAEHNFRVLGLEHAQVVCADSEAFLRATEHVDTIYLDPARRDEHGAKTYAIEDCTPNVLELKSVLLGKADRVLVKLSPMLDWHKAVESLGDVSEIHIVSVGNECKEMLLVMEKSPMKPSVFCVNDGQTSVFEAADCALRYCNDAPLDGRTLIVPNSSIMKSGLFGQFCQRYNAEAVGMNSRLFVLGAPFEGGTLPGRTFLIRRVTTMNKAELRQALAGIDRANIATRNFPLTPADLRKRLKIKDGGGVYIFGTTDVRGQHILLVCEKKTSCDSEISLHYTVNYTYLV